MSQVRIRVADAESNNPIQEATVYSLNSSGDQTGVLGTTDSIGAVTIEAPEFGKKVQVDFPGYEPQEIDPAYFPPEGVVYLNPTNENLGAVIIKSTAKKKKPNYTLPILLGSASIVCFGLWLWKSKII